MALSVFGDGKPDCNIIIYPAPITTLRDVVGGGVGGGGYIMTKHSYYKLVVAAEISVS